MGHVSIVEREGIAVLTLDRPPANAMDLGLLGDLVEAVQRLAADVPPAVVVAGRDGFFSAGADLKAVPGYGPAEQRGMVEGDQRDGARRLRPAVPGRVRHHGPRHRRRDGARAVRRPPRRVERGALRPDGGQGRRALPAGGDRRRASRAPARRRRAALALGNRLVDAAECVRLGAFDEAIAPGEVLDRALAVAQELAAMPAAVYARTKAELRGATLAALRISAERDPLLDAWVGAP